jgi:branched-subunit amino acid aminotransferase/4-amino-4-deoxychorismate lyase
VNGRLSSPHEAVVSAGNSAFLFGEGVFETMWAKNGGIAYLDRHLNRLIKGIEFLGFPPLDMVEIRRGLSAALNAAGEGSWRVRLTSSQEGTGAPSTVIQCREAPHPPEAWKAVFSTTRRDEKNPLLRHKTTSYLLNKIERGKAIAQRADEAIFLNLHGQLTEGTASNIFVLQGRELLTAPAEAGLLPGVMRSVLLERTIQHWSPSEVHMDRDAVFEADALFFTNSILGITACSVLEGVPLPEEKSLETLKSLRELIWLPEDFQAP